ncbi:uncharacterized protein AKAME5_000868600 [Lates japonicus]|uniref:Uncharacterized protein n=1 Tax=Lates japonicus TaxID=270547 RepID=A0AAD3MMZ8_LATJO|nr:uncharacterized protein AKAME5_000868600 [Lates japonicus]
MLPPAPQESPRQSQFEGGENHNSTASTDGDTKEKKTAGQTQSGSANIEPPPDLLQQLLQYTTQRMRNVGQSVGGIGDSALEEAVEYFASVSELLEEKLKVKRAVETRLMQLLSRIEMASLRKPGPEDCALFSEDSGIGAESESLAGSERRHRRESWESTGTNRTTPNRSAKTKVAGSPKTSRRQWADEEERSPRRPQTAAPVRRAVVKKTPVSREQRSRLDDEPTRDEELWGSQSDLRATPRSASHPDLCVVGQALYRD